MERSLFGGAITCHIPLDWRDVSDIRQVPDHQECWQDQNGRLLVIEILERQKDIADATAAAYFFDDMASANETTITERRFVPQAAAQAMGRPLLFQTASPFLNGSSLLFGVGNQRVALGRAVDIAGNPRKQEVRWIRVELAVLRLPSVETDLLITLSTPSETNPQEEEASPNTTTITTTTGHGSDIAFSDVFQQAIGSFHIRDWSLFG